jgi:hypothetical protein
MWKPKLPPFFVSAEGAAVFFEAAIRFGLLGGASLTAALGQFMLAAVLALIALGMFVRLWRGKINKK